MKWNILFISAECGISRIPVWRDFGGNFGDAERAISREKTALGSDGAERRSSQTQRSTNRRHIQVKIPHDTNDIYSDISVPTEGIFR